MLDEKDLLAIGQLMDQRLAQQKQDILGEMDLRMAQQKEEILSESTHHMKVLLDAEVKPQFNLLAEELSIIREKMIPETRIEAIEDDVAILKAAVRQLNRDVRELKKAQ